MAAPTQLYRRLGKGAQVATDLFLGKADPVFSDVSGFPICYCPDGSCCFEFNYYLYYLFREERYSLVGGKGGSYTQEASNLSPLIRYLHYNQISALDMTENRFRAFMAGLKSDRDEKGELIRNANTRRAIGSVSLCFLHRMAEFYGRANFVSPEGTIRGYKNDANLPKRLRKKARRLRFYHTSFPSPGPDRFRHPIGDISLQKIYIAAGEVGVYDTQERNKVLVSVLEHMGGRREECARLMIKDIVSAYETGSIQPLIKIITLKRDGSYHRFVPVPRLYVSQWVSYIRSSRLLVMDDTKALDEGYLFINLKNGKSLQGTTISNIVSELRIAARMDGKAHPHMFRHRFITNKLKMIMLQFDFENTDNFRRSLADFSGFRQKLQQWTGHARIESLERYIHLACDELSDFGPAVENALQAEAFRAVSRALKDVGQKWKDGTMTEGAYGKEVHRVIEEGLAGAF